MEKTIQEQNLEYIDDTCSENEAEMVLEFLKDVDLENELIDDIRIDTSFLYDTINVTIDNKEYTIIENEDEAEANAREQLDEDPEIRNFWIQDLQANDSSNESLEEYKDRIINFDGWPHVLCVYDGEYYTTTSGYVYWQVN